MDFSKITDDLFIGKTPQSQDYPLLRSLGVRLVINMRFERRPYPDFHEEPITSLWLPTIDSPLIPIPIRALRKGVLHAIKIIEAGDKVYVHCAQGSHRGVAMGAAILIAQGYPSEEAMTLIEQKRPEADPRVWYIRRRILKFERAWDHQGEGMLPADS